MKISGSSAVLTRIQEAAKIHLFLDYDGTLAEFAPTPDEIIPDPDLIALLENLKTDQRINLAVISGRRLSHIRKLIPIPGMLLAGTYGIEILDPSGTKIERLDYQEIRPTLDLIKPAWVKLIRDHDEFYLEDKGWTLALHAKFVNPELAEQILEEAQLVIDQIDFPQDLFRILGGHRFLEIAPRLANKGLTIRYLISRYPLKGALPIYIGDDDKDEEAFVEIIKNKGIPIKVGTQSDDTQAQLRIDSPPVVRRFLASLL